MKTIRTEKELYTHTELEKLLNIGQNIINERSKNRKDGSLNRYNKEGNLWRKGDGIKYFEISEVKNELALRPYRKNAEIVSEVEKLDVKCLLLRIADAVETLAKAWK